VLAGDMSDFSLAKKAVDLALSRWGRLDAVVCNHGGLDPVKKVADSSPEEWRDAFGGNVFGVLGLVSFDSCFSLFLFCSHAWVLAWSRYNVCFLWLHDRKATGDIQAHVYDASLLTVYLGPSCPPVASRHKRSRNPHILRRLHLRLPRLGRLRSWKSRVEPPRTNPQRRRAQCD
jgi:hypothetical protein